MAQSSERRSPCGGRILVDRVGRSVAHYRILSLLGEGGMGVVYRAVDERLQRTVALKLLAQELLDDEEARKRFLREARAAAALDHPNAGAVYEAGEADGHLYIAMPLYEGEGLDRRLARERRLSVALSNRPHRGHQRRLRRVARPTAVAGRAPGRRGRAR